MGALNSLQVIRVEHTRINVDLVASRRAVVLHRKSLPLLLFVFGALFVIMIFCHREKRLSRFDSCCEDHLGEDTLLVSNGLIADSFDEKAVRMVEFFG